MLFYIHLNGRIVGVALASHGDVDYALLRDVFFNPEDEILDISDLDMLNYVKG